jgi:hypothetical protein
MRLPLSSSGSYHEDATTINNRSLLQLVLDGGYGSRSHMLGRRALARDLIGPPAR